MVKALILATLATLAACASVADGPSPSDPRSIWCAHNSPRRDAKAGMPHSTLNEIVRHNALGEKWCGWKP